MERPGTEKKLTGSAEVCARSMRSDSQLNIVLLNPDIVVPCCFHLLLLVDFCRDAFFVVADLTVAALPVGTASMPNLVRLDVDLVAQDLGFSVVNFVRGRAGAPPMRMTLSHERFTFRSVL